MVPFFHSAAAFAVVGVHDTCEPEAQFVAVTVVVAALAASVNVPTALLRPWQSCRTVLTIFARSRSDCGMVSTLIYVPARFARYRFPSCVNSGSTLEAKVHAVAAAICSLARASRVDTFAGQSPLLL